MIEYLNGPEDPGVHGQADSACSTAKAPMFRARRGATADRNQDAPRHLGRAGSKDCDKMIWATLQKLTRQELAEGMLQHLKQLETQVSSVFSGILVLYLNSSLAPCPWHMMQCSHLPQCLW